MKRPHVNAWIDGLAFAAFLFLFVTGLILKYQLPAGSGGVLPRGGGRGADQRPVTLLWGWTRHEWGDFHFWIAVVLIAILSLHLVLHWKWIVCTVRGAHNDASGLRFAVGLASLTALLMMAALPLLTPTDVVRRGELRRLPGESAPARPADEARTQLKGSMTVAEVAEKSGLSVAELTDKLGLPDGIEADMRIGQVLRIHGLQMSDLRNTLGQAHTSNYGRQSHE